MYAGDFEGEEIIKSEEKLQEVLRKRPAFDANNFILTFSEDGFPQLNIFVKKDICIIYYIEENSENFVSYDEFEYYEHHGETEIFYESMSGEETELSSENIVPINKMYEVATEFFVTKTRPRCIKWTEL
ncbi:Imm1 family immunity protein [Flavobacterium sp. MMS24-S5]|uniref:Imm1 family immunity protein n=1 Tax=Flavobacterium sp. MMS24-S5 TaxID=3416605 RepID=UPI003CFD2EBF